MIRVKIFIAALRIVLLGNMFGCAAKTYDAARTGGVNATDNNSFTPLHVAACDGKKEVAESKSPTV